MSALRRGSPTVPVRGIDGPIYVPEGSLLRILGFAFGIAVSVGSSIGSGILRFPGEDAAHLPSPGLFLGVWIAGGLYALISAPSMAELGTMMLRAGAAYLD